MWLPSGAYIQCSASLLRVAARGCLLELCCREYILFLTMCIRYMNGTLIKAIDSVGDPPLPIPNREVKPVSADGTAKIRGRVGHRHFSERELQAIEALFFCC